MSDAVLDEEVLREDEPKTEGTAVFVSDPSAEAARVGQALRAVGYRVADVPLAILVARVEAESPRVVILDADAEGAKEAALALGGAEPDRKIAIVFLGQAVPSDGEAGPRPELFFERPVDTGALAAQLDQLMGGPPRREETLSIPPTSAAPPRPPPPPSSRDLLPTSSSPPLMPPSTRASPPPPSVRARESRLPLEQPAPSLGMRPMVSIRTALSAELEAMLEDADQRASGGLVQDAMLPTPEEEIAAVLPADLLASLDEPLEDEEEDFGDSSPPRSVLDDRPLTVARAAETSAGRVVTPPPPPVVSPAAGDYSPAITITEGVRSTAAPSLRMSPTVAPPTSLRDMEPPSAWAPPVQAIHVPPAPPLPVPAPPPVAPAAPAAPALPSEAPRVLVGAGAVVRELAQAIRARKSGALCFESPDGLRRAVLREGDIVTAASSADDETLLAFLTGRGDLRREQVKELQGKLAPFGRLAGAALVAHGLLRQDQLWPALRAHAEWILGRAMVIERGTVRLEAEPPGRLSKEPSVFGGSTGAEVLVEVTRRAVGPEEALSRLGGRGARVMEGEAGFLLSECALDGPERAWVEQSRGSTVGEMIDRAAAPELACILYVVSLLGVVTIVPPAAAAPALELGSDGQSAADVLLDAAAVRERVRARFDLVREADYFTLLGVAPTATGYEVRRAFVELRRAFEPSRILTPEIADLEDDVKTILAVLDEAYDILRDTARRERYRRALGASPS